MKRTLLLAVVSISLAGCGESKIDGKSEDAYQASITKISHDLPESKRQEFSESLSVVAMKEINMNDIFSGKQTAESFKTNAIASLDGKTASQVIDEASKIRTQREAKEKQQAIDEISELLTKKSAADLDKAELAKFAVDKSRFSKEPQQYSDRSQPIIDISVTNGTSHAISRAYFKGTIASPGRSVPWFSDDFNYSISGGLEPGEKASWRLAPNSYGDWGKVNAPADAVLTVEVVRLDGPDEKALFDSRQFTDGNQKRLEALQKKYPTN